MLYKYLVMEGRYNIDEEAADVMFVTYDKEEPIETAKDFGQGMVVVSVDNNGSKQRVFTAPYNSDFGFFQLIEL